MRLLFSSSFVCLVEEMGKRLSDAGIAYEVRYRPARRGTSHFSAYCELWIKEDHQLHWATSLVPMQCEVATS